MLFHVIMNQKSLNEGEKDDVFWQPFFCLLTQLNKLVSFKKLYINEFELQSHLLNFQRSNILYRFH